MGMKAFVFTGIATKSGWLTPGHLLVKDGLIAGATAEAPANVPTERIDGYLLPGFPNAHSHAFQFAMTGLAEHLPRASQGDDFWSWREAMYRLALNLEPDEIEAIARMLYIQLVKHGATDVLEFHYLHHDPAGRPYDNLAEVSERLMVAANDAGIRLTLAPMYYRNGDFGVAAKPEQRRFIFKDRDAYHKLVESVRESAQKYGVVVGAGVHSLRAADEDECRAILDSKTFSGPLHIHAAEQVKEVERCLAAWGKRPVRWLLDNVALSPRHSLVHCTHLDASEIQDLARSGATAVICPSTEGNLGDGFFSLRDYRAAKGAWAIGTDSHVGLSFFEELRWLDYGQRLSERRRNVLCRTGGDESGDLAFWEAWTAGRTSLGLGGEPWQQGARADGVLIDADHAAVIGKPTRHLLSAMVYAGDACLVKSTLKGGEWLVKERRHPREDAARRSYIKVMQRLVNAPSL